MFVSYLCILKIKLMSENLEWIKASSIKFKTKKEATERMKLMKECIDKYGNYILNCTK